MAGASTTTGPRTVNLKVLPTSTSLSTSQSPPMSVTSSRLMERPRPAPSYFLEVEVSACSNGWKITSSLSAGIPSPVSAISNLISVSVSFMNRGDANNHLADLCELNGVADQIDEDLAQSSRVTNHHPRHGLID